MQVLKEGARPMLMAELSRRSGVPVATIKYYLREGLLPPGRATSATRAQYGEAHLRRLRLIRALVEIGEVPVAGIAKILAAVDDESESLHVMLGTVQYQLGPHPSVKPSQTDGDESWQAATREADDLIAAMGWKVTRAAPARTLLIAALATIRRTSAAPPAPGLRAYAEAVASLTDKEVASVDRQDADRQDVDRVAVAESAVVGMVLYERVLVALRRLAQEDASARHFG
jgi:DNA-binding transcriptional MerR regulator